MRPRVGQRGYYLCIVSAVTALLLTVLEFFLEQGI
jgi:hypothetical protein